MLRLYLDTIDKYTTNISILIGITIGLCFPILVYSLPSGILNIFLIYLLSLLLLIIRRLLTVRSKKFHNSPLALFTISNTIIFFLFYPFILDSFLTRIYADIGLFVLIASLIMIPFYLISKSKSSSTLWVTTVVIIAIITKLNIHFTQLNLIGKITLGCVPIFLFRILFNFSIEKTDK